MRKPQSIAECEQRARVLRLKRHGRLNIDDEYFPRHVLLAQPQQCLPDDAFSREWLQGAYLLDYRLGDQAYACGMIQALD